MKLIISHSKEIISAIIAGVIIAIISTLILDFIYEETGPDEAFYSAKDGPEDNSVPHLWSHHKLLGISVDECSTQALSILKTLGFSSVVKNEQYVYGNYQGNRAAIKCVELADKSFVYTAVAGADVKLVEQLRNKISWKL